MALLHELQQGVELRLVRALQQREYPARLVEEALRDRRCDLVEVVSSCHGLAVREAEPRAFANGEAIHLDVARGNRDLAGRDAGQRLRHVGHVLIRRAVRREADHRREPRENRASRQDTDSLRGKLGRLLGGQDHVRVVRQDDHLVGVRGIDCREQICRRGVHGLPALDHPRRTEAVEEAAVPVPDRRPRRRRSPSVVRPAPRRAGAPPAAASARACSRSRRARSRPRSCRPRARVRARRCGRAPSARPRRRRRGANRRAARAPTRSCRCRGARLRP